jgi:hypothetical protein
MLNRKALIAVAAVAAGLAGTASIAHAGEWQQTHPRRAEVNRRLGNQNARIRHDVRDGDMSHSEARILHQDDHQIRQEERDMASQDNGHITRTEQRALNQQENQVSRQISQY